MLRHPVKLERDTNGAILVWFPEMLGAQTFDDDEDEAIRRALDALETALSAYIADRKAIPRPPTAREG